MYRDETETLRAELDRARAELATLKTKPSKREVIDWFDKWGDPLPWVESAKRSLLGSAAVTALAGIGAEARDHRMAALVAVALVAVLLASFVWLWWRALPRVTVKR